MDMMLEQFRIIFDRPEKVKKLREMILNLAVRGKLVEQDPNDEPASVLLERIREEKERLVKEKKIKKEKPLVEISKEEIPYELPNGWEWARLPCVYSVYGNSNSKIKTNELEQDGKYPVVSQGKELIVGYSNQEDKIIKLDGRTIVVFGDHTKEVKLINFDFICGADGVKVLLPICCNIKYFYCFLKSVDLDSRDYGRNFKILNEKLITLPPIEEQKRIVEKVDSLMIFCNKLEQSLEKKVHYGSLSAKSVFNSIGNATTTEELEETLRFILSNFKELSLGDNAVKELKNCILQLAVQGKLVPQDSSDEPAEVVLEKIQKEKERLIKEKKIKEEKPLAEINEEEKPYGLQESWKWIRLKKVIQDIAYGTSKKSDYNIEGVAVLRIPNVSNGILDLEDIKYTNLSESELGRLSLEKDDLLIIRSNGSSDIVGKGILIEEDMPKYSYAGYLIRLRLVKKLVFSKYINMVIKSNLVRNQIEPNLRTTTGVKNINSDEISKLLIPLPPLEEQKRIVEKVDSLMQLCDELEKKIEKSKNYSNRLMESILK